VGVNCRDMTHPATPTRPPLAALGPPTSPLQGEESPSPPHGERPVIVLVGLRLEARIAIGENAIVVCHDKVRGVPDLLEAALKAGCTSIISFGLAGALAPQYLAGDCVVASGIVDQGRLVPTSALWTSRLLETVPHAIYAPILGVDTPIIHTALRRDSHLLSLAIAADNESHIVARFAVEHGLELAALRVVIDPAHRRVPQTVLAGLKSDGSTDLVAMLRGLILRPGQTLDLLRLTADYVVARARLLEARRLLGADFGASRSAIPAVSCDESSRT
jgi:adenosylhomocysteine nucleosidase